MFSCDSFQAMIFILLYYYDDFILFFCYSSLEDIFSHCFSERVGEKKGGKEWGKGERKEH